MPAGTSTLSFPASRGAINPFSIPNVTMPIVPWPHMGRQPLVSMKRMPQSQSGCRSGIEKPARHHVMPPRLEHEPGANPVELLEKILPPRTHARAFKHRRAADHQPDRVSGRVSIDAEERVSHGVRELLQAFPIRISTCSVVSIRGFEELMTVAKVDHSGSNLKHPIQLASHRAASNKSIRERLAHVEFYSAFAHEAAKPSNHSGASHSKIDLIGRGIPIDDIAAEIAYERALVKYRADRTIRSYADESATHLQVNKLINIHLFVRVTMAPARHTTLVGQLIGRMQILLEIVAR